MNKNAFPPGKGRAYGTEAPPHVFQAVNDKDRLQSSGQLCSLFLLLLTALWRGDTVLRRMTAIIDRDRKLQYTLRKTEQSAMHRRETLQKSGF